MEYYCSFSISIMPAIAAAVIISHYQLHHLYTLGAPCQLVVVLTLEYM